MKFICKNIYNLLILNFFLMFIFSKDIVSMKSAEDTYQIMQKADLDFRSLYGFKIFAEKIRKILYKDLRNRLIRLIEDDRCEDIALKYNNFLDNFLDDTNYKGYLNLKDFEIDNIKTDYGETLLEFSILNNYAKCINTLINLGANPNLVNYQGDSYLMLAVKNNNFKAVKALLSKRSKRNKVNINYVNKNTGETALGIAKKENKSKIISILLENGAKF